MNAKETEKWGMANVILGVVNLLFYITLPHDLSYLAIGTACLAIGCWLLNISDKQQ